MGRQEQIGVLVVDDHAGIRAGLARLIDAERPALRAASACAVLVLTHAPGALLAALALRQGAVACLDKAAPSDRLLAALRLAARR